VFIVVLNLGGGGGLIGHIFNVGGKPNKDLNTKVVKLFVIYSL
jgi:hypothetical protein